MYEKLKSNRMFLNTVTTLELNRYKDFCRISKACRPLIFQKVSFKRDILMQGLYFAPCLPYLQNGGHDRETFLGTGELLIKPNR